MAAGSKPRPELIAAMLKPDFYADAPSEVELRETHTSWVMLAGERAYKVKKQVAFQFLDYGSVERRREMCVEEVRANRRLAPGIYLRVLGIARSGDSYRLVSEDDPAAIEYAVEMRRVDEERTLEALLRRAELDRAAVAAVARMLARFHAESEPAPPSRCALDALIAPQLDNLDTLRDVAGGILDEDSLAAADGFTRRFIAARGELLAERGRAGLVRDCHGDLRAEHVIVPASGEPYVFDCIEFNPALRYIDVSSDLAFLFMDLTRLGAEREASDLVATYRDAGGDPGEDAAFAYYSSYRAWVRAKVALLLVAELDVADPRREASGDEARSLLRLGRRLAWGARRPLLVAVCGIAATGKTSLAAELAAVSGLEHLSSDVTRKRLAGIEPTEPAGAEHYSAEFTRRTYQELGSRAAVALGHDGGAIVDATFHLRAERAAFLEALGDTAAAVVFVECRAPEETLIARVRARAPETDRTSDADADVVRRQLAELEPLDELPAQRRATLDTEAPADRLATRVEQLVDERIWEAGTSTRRR